MNREHLRHLLIVEDILTDAEIVLDELRQAGFDPQWQRVETERDYLAALDNNQLDLILADYSLPQFSALRALQLLTERGLDIPFIIVSGSIGEERAIEALKQGATDYLLKDRLARLGEAVRQAIRQKHLRVEKHEIQRALQESEEHFRALVENSEDLIAVLDASGIIQYANPALERLLGYPLDALIGHSSFKFFFSDESQPDRTDFEMFLAAHGTLSPRELRVRHKDNSLRTLEVIGSNMLDRPGVQGIVINARDITERKQAEEALHQSEERFSKTFFVSPVAILISSLQDGRIVDANESFLELSGFSREEMIGRTSLELLLWANPEDRAHVGLELQEQQKIRNREYDFRNKAGEIRNGVFDILKGNQRQ